MAGTILKLAINQSNTSYFHLASIAFNLSTGISMVVGGFNLSDGTAAAAFLTQATSRKYQLAINGVRQGTAILKMSAAKMVIKLTTVAKSVLANTPITLDVMSVAT